MSAIDYLLGRGWPSAWKVSALMTLGTVLLWLNLKSAALTPGWLAGMLGGGIGSVLGGGLAFGAALLAGATVLGLILLAPLYALSGCIRRLHLWTRRRVLEEMLCAGVSSSKVLDRAALFALRWWGVVVLPSVLVGVLSLPSLRLVLTPTIVLGYLLTLAALFYLGAFVSIWSGLCRGKLKFPLLGALLGLQAIPVCILMANGFASSTLVGSLLSMAVAARWFAIGSLKNIDTLQNLESRVGHVFRFFCSALPRPSRARWENPIVFRQALRGADPSELMARLLVAGSFALALLGTVLFDSLAVFGVLLVGVVLFNCYRAAERMSGIVTEEVEGSTLEMLRVTPLGSERFFKGWLQAVLGPLFGETVTLLTGVLLATAALGHSGVLFSRWVAMAIALCFALPLAAAHVGASTAGHAQSRAEASGRLLLSFGTFVVAAAPQALVLTQFVSLPVSLGGLAVMTALLCWLLGSGARKSLDKVFLPQNE